VRGGTVRGRGGTLRGGGVTVRAGGTVRGCGTVRGGGTGVGGRTPAGRRTGGDPDPEPGTRQAGGIGGKGTCAPIVGSPSGRYATGPR
jgi:hypothetical protein